MENTLDFSGIITAIIALAAVFTAGKLILKLQGKYEDLTDIIALNNLQMMVHSLDRTADNYEKIELEFEKLKIDEKHEQALTLLWEIFVNRFGKISRTKSSINIFAGQNLKVKVENMLKAELSQIEEISKERSKTKALATLQEISKREDRHINFADAYEKILSECFSSKTTEPEPVKIKRNRVKKENEVKQKNDESK